VSEQLLFNANSAILIFDIHRCTFEWKMTFFLAHLAKGNVSFCHHLASVVRDARTISVNIHSYPFLADQLELSKTEILSPHL